ncbi:nodulation protein NfeD [Streptomyces sp. F63]|uniref:NfeD family protein n=1 Tax=Streptomyces sp. F63 TaxID=2824887 RepID=UPI001B3909DB|nr:nodulation protein NfeD [Streptomyces sp. F63]MBQ0985785.1 nodulation protein NfeD [Streptomyces sp. F63]
MARAAEQFPGRSGSCGRPRRRGRPAGPGPRPGRVLPSPARLCARALLVTLAGFLALPAAGAAPAEERTVLATRVDGTITPVVESHLDDGLRRAEEEGHPALLVELDTPGGLLESTRGIVRGFLNAEVPVIVHVSPSGARAASAGAYITMAAHVAAMAPGTHIGAGTPVGGQGEEASEKVVNDSAAFAVSIAEQRGRDTGFAEDMVREGTSVSDRTALRENVVDLVEPSRRAVLDAADGRRVRVGPEGGGREVVLRTAGARVVEYDLGFFGELRQLLASPELAYLFLSIGTLAVIYELASPGMGFGGVIGAIALLLGFTALSVLPFDVAGLFLILLAAALFAGEVFTPGVGVFAASGTIALVFAGIFLFRGETEVDPAVLWPTALVVGAGSLIAGRLAWRARRGPPTTGGEALLGREAVVRRTEGDRGRVLLDGAWWDVRGRDAPLAEGQRVRVVDRQDLVLVVEQAGSGVERPPREKE